MSHNSSISGMGEPALAIRVINEKQLHQIMVGINIILGCGKEFVKHGNSFASQGGRIWISYRWRKVKWPERKKIVWIKVLCILERHCWKVRAGVSGFLTFKNIWHDLNYKNANNFLGFKLPKWYAYWIPLCIRSCCWKNDMLSFQIKASLMHIGPKWLCQPEIGYTTPHYFSKLTHPLSDWVWIVQ